MRLAIPGLVVLAVALGACGGSRAATDDAPGDDDYGHRYGPIAPDGRETATIAPPDTTGRVLIYPAVLDSVGVRPARPRTLATDPTPVEVLLKGIMPDACSALDGVAQERTGHFIRLTLNMRQPRGRACTQVVRPFRFYVALDGLFAPGAYTLTVNGSPTPFRILAAEPDPE